MYTLLGALLGLLGEAGALSTLSGPFSPTAVSQFLKVGAGVLLLTMGALMLTAWLRGSRARLPEPTAAVASLPWFGRTVARLAKSGGWWGLPLGALMGLLPCAPLLPVELAALATGEPLYGAMIMLAFGVGTVPALAGFGAASGLLGARARGWFAPVAATMVILLGAVTIAQGLATAGAL
jgi:sulfite exporter TauE/SafE